MNVRLAQLCAFSLLLAPCMTQTHILQTVRQSSFYEALEDATPLLIAIPLIMGTTQILSKSAQLLQKKIGTLPTIALGQLGTLAALCYYRQRIKPQPTPVAQRAQYVALVNLSGTVSESEKFHKALHECLCNDQIKGIILKIDAEWGDLGICHTLYREIKRARQQKPLVALIEKACCREPYLIACAADKIIANEQSTIGMIGTTRSFVQHRTNSATPEIWYFYAGKLTPVGNPHHTLTSEEQQAIVHQLEIQYQQLCTTISQERKLNIAQISSWADGKPFTGQQAVQMQLVDQIGSLSDAYDVVAELLATKNIQHQPLEPLYISAGTI